MSPRRKKALERLKVTIEKHLGHTVKTNSRAGVVKRVAIIGDDISRSAAVMLQIDNDLFPLIDVDEVKSCSCGEGD